MESTGPKLIKKIGNGTIGEFYLSRLDNSNIDYATKRIDKKIIEKIYINKSLKREIAILKELKEINHKNIIKFINIQEDNNYQYISLEYCNGGNLFDCLQKYRSLHDKKAFSEEIVQYLMRQIVEGLKCIHQNGIIHRDLRLDNFLVHYDSNEDKDNLNLMKSCVKIGGFGISIKAKEATSLSGNSAYADPIILARLSERNDFKNSDGYDKSADIWSLGVVCYEMLLGRKVFNGRNIQELINNIQIGNYSIPKTLSKEIASFLNGMLQYEPKKRLKIEELAKHEFLNKNSNNFEKIDVDLLGSKVMNSKININIKNNSTIWDILNDDFKLKAMNKIIYSIPDDENDAGIEIPEFLKKSKFNKFLNQSNRIIQNNNKYNRFNSHEIENNMLKNNYELNIYSQDVINNQNNLKQSHSNEINNQNDLKNNYGFFRDNPDEIKNQNNMNNNFGYTENNSNEINNKNSININYGYNRYNSSKINNKTNINNNYGFNRDNINEINNNKNNNYRFNRDNINENNKNNISNYYEYINKNSNKTINNTNNNFGYYPAHTNEINKNNNINNNHGYNRHNIKDNSKINNININYENTFNLNDINKNNNSNAIKACNPGITRQNYINENYRLLDKSNNILYNSTNISNNTLENINDQNKNIYMNNCQNYNNKDYNPSIYHIMNIHNNNKDYNPSIYHSMNIQSQY